MAYRHNASPTRSFLAERGVYKYKRGGAMKTKVYLCVLNLIIFSPSLYSINIGKLQLKNLTLKNSTDETQKLFVTNHNKCYECSSKYLIKEKISIKPQKQKTISPDTRGYISDATPTNKHSHLVFQENNNTLQIQTNQEYDFPIHINFRESTKHPRLEKYLNGQDDNFLQKLMPEKVTPSEFLGFLNFIYDQNNLSKKFLKLPISTKLELMRSRPKIPQILHQIWFGNEMPLLYKKWQRTWRKKHPGWKFICWSEDLVNQTFPTKLYNKKTFDRAKENKNYAQMSDVARYEILLKYGGAFCDSDSFCLEKTDLLNQLYDFYTVLEEMDTGLCCANGFIGVKPNHPIMATAIKCISNYENLDQEKLISYWIYKTRFHPKAVETLLKTGPGLLSKSILLSIGKNNNIDIVLPHEYFLPTNNPERRSVTASFCYHDYLCPEIKDKKHWTDKK